MKTIITATITALLCLTLAGCASIQNFSEDNPATARLVTDQLTLRFITASDKPAERATAVRAVVQTVRSDVNTSAQATLASIEQRVRDEINWRDMEIADQQLLEFALLKARQSLTDLIGDGALDPSERTTVGTLLDWVDAAAERVEAR